MNSVPIEISRSGRWARPLLPSVEKLHRELPGAPALRTAPGSLGLVEVAMDYEPGPSNKGPGWR